MFAIPNGFCPGALDAFLKFCLLVDCILEISRGRDTITPAMLLARVESFLEAFVAEWGVDEMTPKVHWLLHYHREFYTHGTLFSCFTMERKHKIVRQYANQIRNTMKFELSALSEVICEHLAALDSMDTFESSIGLIQAHRASKAVKKILLDFLELPDRDDVLVSKKSRLTNGDVVHRGDVVLIKQG